MADEWFPDDQHGYSIALCACKDGPYLGARQMGTPCVCERCGRLTREQWDFLVDRLLDAHATPSDAAEVARCPECRHAPHGSLGFCPNMASDNDCACKFADRDAARLTKGERSWGVPMAGHVWFTVDDVERILASRAAAAPVGVERVEWGFLYDGKPEWSSHAHVPWGRDGAENYRLDAVLWRVPDLVGALIRRTVTTHPDRVGEWEVVDDA